MILLVAVAIYTDAVVTRLRNGSYDVVSSRVEYRYDNILKIEGLIPSLEIANPEDLADFDIWQKDKLD